MNKIPTAEEFLFTIIDDDNFKDWTKFLYTGKHTSTWESYLSQCLKNFAKLHVEAALGAAAEKAELNHYEWVEEWMEVPFNCTIDERDNIQAISKESILNSYPLENIK